MESSVIFIGYHRDLYFPANPFVNTNPTQREPPLLTRFLLGVLLLFGGMNCQLPTTGHHDRSEINE